MTLAKNDHIYVGVGQIYGPPFLARVLLYRLFDCNCAALVYHPVGETASIVGDVGRVQVMSARAGEKPTNFRVHISSASSALEVADMLSIPPTVLQPPEEAASYAFGPLVLRIERFKLPFTERLINAYECHPWRAFRIAESPYQVSGRMDTSLWPDVVRSARLERQCWKFSVLNSNHKKVYDLDSDLDWGLTALDAETDEHFHSAHSVNLKKLPK